MDNHKAYNVALNFNQNLIESISGFENNIIIGTKIGQLFMYSMPNADEIQERRLVKYYQTDQKNPITQMKIVPDKKLLFILTNSMINVYDTSGFNFTLIHRCEETKGCNIFTMQVETLPPSDETASSIMICVIIKRMLRFFHWKTDSLELLKTNISLESIPKALGWTDDIICIGLRDKYVVYKFETQMLTLEKYNLISTSQDVNPYIFLIQNSILGITIDEFFILIDSENITEQNAFLANNVSRSIKWSSSIFDLVWDEPYVIGLTANGIEVRVLEGFVDKNDTLIQYLPQLDDVKFLVQTSSGCIFAASTTEVWYIRMVDIPIQREILLQKDQIKLAIMLTKVSKEPKLLKKQLIREMRTSFAKKLFAKKKFAIAMEEFEKAKTDPRDVIQLFPVAVKCKLTTIESLSQPDIEVILEGKELNDAIEALIDYLGVRRKKEDLKIKNTIGPRDSSNLSFINQTLLEVRYL